MLIAFSPFLPLPNYDFVQYQLFLVFAVLFLFFFLLCFYLVLVFLFVLLFSLFLFLTFSVILSLFHNLTSFLGMSGMF